LRIFEGGFVLHGPSSDIPSFAAFLVGASLLANGVLPEGVGRIPKNALSLTLSLKGEGTVGQTLMFWNQPASTEIAG
jgi:hypothetical protein